MVLFYSFVFGQKENVLVQKIRDNQTLMKSDMDKGYKELLPLEKQSDKENNTKAKLEVLNNKAFFYFTQAHYDKAYKYARQLEKEATKIKDIRLTAIAMNRVGITLNFLGAYSESENKLLQSKKYIEKNNFENKNLIKANNFQFLSDLYSNIENRHQAIYYIKKTLPEYEKIENPKERKKQIVKGYGNIGLKYLDLNLDSAAYYFNKSLALQDTIEIKNYNVSNYVGLGEVYNKKGEHQKAIEYLKKAENINNVVQDGFYMTTIYELMQDSYKKTGDKTDYNKYKLLYLENLQKENEEILSGVNTLVNEVKKESQDVIDDNRKKTYLIISFAILTSLSVILFLNFQRNFRRKQQEREEIEKELIDKEKQLENLETKVSDLLHEVMNLAKENSEKFYPRFLDLYPNFEQKLLEISPKLTKSELEFCALLKLNFSSKEIANYTFISVRTVQNKKYRLRSKLNIPNTTDTNVFFNTI